MRKSNGTVLGSALAMSLVLGTAGSSLAGMNPQGMNPQGMNPQGMNPQGMNPQGMNPQSISLDGVSTTNLSFLNGDTLTNATLSGSQLAGYVNGAYASGTAFIGATLHGTLLYENDGVTASQDVTLFIADVKQDTTKNTMVCDPMNPSAVSCFRNYSSNSDVYLYKIFYWVGDLEDVPTIAPLCAGDQMAMLFSGTYDDEGAWVQDVYQKKLTVACSQGVLTKCARNWGYKPWRSMVDKHGNVNWMRSYHQACTRAAKADYSGLGLSFTVTGTTIDMFDNGGYNLPATAAELTAAGYQSATRFEAIFTSNKKVNSIKPDFWANWMSGVRFEDLPQWEAMYDYPDIDWDGEAPKASLSDLWAASAVVTNMESRYAQNNPEIAVYNPVWSAVGTNVATGATTGGFDHATPTCRPTSNAPDRAFRWYAPTAGTYQINTNGSTYDTVLYVYDSGAELACDDDSGAGTQSLLTVTVAAGQEITIFVDGYATAAGNFNLSIVKLP